MALGGSASILLLARITRRMTGSDLLGCVAGLLLALDGLAPAELTRLHPAPSCQDPGAPTFARPGQALVIGSRRHEVADAQVARANPLTPRHPRWRQQRIRAGQQHDLADRDRLGARGPADGDGPAPARVGRVGALEEVGDHPVGGRLHAEVVADLVGHAGRQADLDVPDPLR